LHYIIEAPAVFCCLVTMRSWVQVLETTSCRKAVKDCVHKTQSCRTLPWTLRNWELRAPGCPLLLKLLQPLAEIQRKVVYIKPQVVGTFPGPCASGSYLHWAAIVEALDSPTVARSSLIEFSLYFVPSLLFPASTHRFIRISPHASCIPAVTSCKPCFCAFFFFGYSE
jgi:hypothetical protein